ncbi:MAG: hypothetical protein ACJZ89_06195 [Paracoccaceae bacterium]
MAGIEFDASLAHRLGDARSSFGLLLTVLVSLISIFLLGGFLYWGYGAFVQSESEVTIIKASDGPLKVLPENPGGNLASHLGFSVNSVQESGQVAGPSAKIFLAPPAINVQESDLTSLSGFGDSNGAIDLKSSINDALAVIFKDKDALNETTFLNLKETSIKKDTAEKIIVSKNFSRPEKRPIKITSTTLHQDLVAQIVLNQVKAKMVDSKNELMVHLGSFENNVLASAHVENFVVRHKDYLINKTVFLQKSETGGRSIYRMRAIGFSNTSETKKFCVIINSFGNDCIPISNKEN